VQSSTDDTEAVAPDPAASGLPALIAALLPGLQQLNPAKPAAVAGNADALSGDSGRKSLQNSVLLPSLLTDGRKGGTARESFAALLTDNAAGRPLAGSPVSATLAAAGQGAQAGGGLVAQLQARQPLIAALVSGGKAEAALQGDAEGLQALTAASGAQHIGLAHGSPRGTSAAQTSLQLPVATPAGQESWAEDVGNQVRWMLGRAESKAELVLSPAHLGKLEVTISLNGDQTTAQFVASNQAARDALEQALPRLRELLQQSGISLGQANVSTSGEQGAGSEQGGRGESTGRGGETGADTIDGTTRTTWLRQHDGLVDTFA